MVRIEILCATTIMACEDMFSRMVCTYKDIWVINQAGLMLAGCKVGGMQTYNLKEL